VRRRLPRLPDGVALGDEMLSAHDVAVAVGGKYLISGVSLSVCAGEFVALIGPNGAGKSTLLAALAGDVGADGVVALAGRELSTWSSVETAMRRSVMPQHNQVSFSFTVRQVVAMGRSPWRGTPWDRVDDAIVALAMSDAQVSHLAGRSVPTLSGGERARVAFARVLAQQTSLLLLDEPTAALDLHHQEMVMGRVARHVDTGGAAVVVVHDLNLAAAYAHRVVLLDGGTVAAEGTPQQVLTPEVLEPVYRHRVTLLDDPVTGDRLVVPDRRAARLDLS
jgi:iron complex transport system ATP-binding protein